MTISASVDASKKIIARIQALLAMGNDTSSEFEAAIAIKRARVLMDKHQISANDMKQMEAGDLDSSHYTSKSFEQVLWISSLAVSVAMMNDCVVVAGKRKSIKEEFFYVFNGFKEDIALCGIMLSYLIDICNNLYLRDKDKLSIESNGRKNQYLVGVAIGLRKRVEIMIEQRNKTMSEACDGRSLMDIKGAMVEQAYGKQTINKTKSYSSYNKHPTAYNAGLKASKEIQLSKYDDADSYAPKKIALTSVKCLAHS